MGVGCVRANSGELSRSRARPSRFAPNCALNIEVTRLISDAVRQQRRQTWHRCFARSAAIDRVRTPFSVLVVERGSKPAAVIGGASRYYAIPMARLVSLLEERSFTEIQRLDGVLYQHQPVLVARRGTG